MHLYPPVTRKRQWRYPSEEFTSVWIWSFFQNFRLVYNFFARKFAACLKTPTKKALYPRTRLATKSILLLFWWKTGSYLVVPYPYKIMIFDNSLILSEECEAWGWTPISFLVPTSSACEMSKVDSAFFCFCFFLLLCALSVFFYLNSDKFFQRSLIFRSCSKEYKLYLFH